VSALAEEEGFEPSLRGIPAKRFSRPPHSTTLPPLRAPRQQELPRYVWHVARRVDRAPCQCIGDARRLASPSAGMLPAGTLWRRARDSNPRYGSTPHTRFPIVRLRPLGQLSSIELYVDLVAHVRDRRTRRHVCAKRKYTGNQSVFEAQTLSSALSRPFTISPAPVDASAAACARSPCGARWCRACACAVAGASG
jgi:hypothetical protein